MQNRLLKRDKQAISKELVASQTDSYLMFSDFGETALDRRKAGQSAGRCVRLPLDRLWPAEMPGAPRSACRCLRRIHTFKHTQGSLHFIESLQERAQLRRGLLGWEIRRERLSDRILNRVLSLVASAANSESSADSLVLLSGTMGVELPKI
jgi:hypothetical protein